MKLGVITDCFKKSHFEGIKLAFDLGLNGVQIYATTGEFSPSTLTDAQKTEYKNLLKEKGLVVSALCGDMGGHGFEIAQDNAERIEKTKEIIDLAAEFGARVVTTHIGVIPADKTNPRYAAMLNALTECGLYAMTKDVTLAIETGPETAATLLQFLQDTKGGVGVNLDPANFVMVTGQDPVEAVYLLKDYIVHTHAKDGIQLKPYDTRRIYAAKYYGLPPADEVTYQEVALGEGKVDWMNYLSALKEIGYNGFLTVERECGADPAKDILTAVTFLKLFIERNKL
jgi:sugar phosphate isomerase/epimerase